ncbi:putative Glycosyltransferase involved in cell wall biogenesis [Vibrio nigripulchritudo MADA3029]|uniref:glycosyltransferase n=1 Tax=Vibrio nigripulchritudo TaxID=28173 RepID=UPI0003B1BB17|nr:glycosyltransferase [Vibrio nigripulchritudo]CCN47433.1 putative Glycosyltransferase involved in cell wall biogenesis [Vibrio nigripulchritudo MADA3020]CCN53272.1 putative Glycosyltransferase involved in cell wall biogenesis [Vibrio nigripulchritudo MADA3021]CCN61429.1 putative Glycosyltransferase involved in cell wall biogenesis [Vibrio nigripulchritudo MADA3029]
MKKISVVIPTYNREDLLSYTLDSLVAQTLDKNLFEVIVVDDGGKDNTEKVINRYRSVLDLQYFWQPDKGFRAGKARNVGTMIADGQYIVYIDTGVLLSSITLEEHLKAHEAAKTPITIVGYVYGFDVDAEALKELEPHLNSKDVDKTLMHLKQSGAYDIRQAQYKIMGEDLSKWPAPFDLFWTCHVSAEREELLKAGLFDESFNTWGGEDVDLGIRLFLNKNEYVMNKAICSLHWPHPKEVSDSDEHSNSAARRIHEKYNIWQTSFYNIDHREDGVPLNRIIQLHRPQEIPAFKTFQFMDMG